MDFVKEQYRHCKPILAFGGAPQHLLSRAGIPQLLGGERPDPGLVLADASEAQGGDPLLAFLAALSRHRHHEREFEVLHG
jgi:catalase